MQHDPGLTGLALLCFLAEGNSINQGLYKSQVSSAAAWLITQQDKRGRIGFKQSADFIYEHAIATLALVEAYGLCGDAGIKSAAVAGLRYLQPHRTTDPAPRYPPRDTPTDSPVACRASPSTTPRPPTSAR